MLGFSRFAGLTLLGFDGAIRLTAFVNRSQPSGLVSICSLPFALLLEIAMPQPFPVEPSLRWYDHAIMNRPEIAARIGLVVTEWAAFERLLAQMFAAMLFGMGMAEHTGEAISLQALGALESLSARLDVISAVLKPRIPDELYLHFRDNLKPEIRRRASERARVVHGPWMLCDDYPDDLIYAPLGERRMRYTATDLDNIATHIIDTRDNVIGFLMQVRIALQQQQAPPAPPSSPHPD